MAEKFIENIAEWEMVLEIEAKSENEAFARTVTALYAARLNPTLEEIDDIKTAVSEAVTNSIIHGYKFKSGKVRVKCTVHNKNEFYVAIEDDGCGIEDIDTAMQPLYTTSPELERSGMGFSFMEAFMDNVFVESKPDVGTKVIMRKIVKM